MSGPPIRNAVLAVDNGIIIGLDNNSCSDARDLGSVALLPGLVNAHTHLELSWLRGQVPPASSMPQWAASLIAARREVSPDPPAPIVDAIAEARAAGTSAVGDVSNTLASYAPLCASALSAVIFRELLGLSVTDPESVVARVLEEDKKLDLNPRVRVLIAPHAPYSVSPALLRSIARAGAGQPLSVHVGESPEEIQFLTDGTGAWRALLESLGVWRRDWQAPRCSPITYLDSVGLVGSHLIAVHGVHLTDAELQRLAAAGATLVTCPRSNRWTGAGEPPLDRFYRSAVRVAVGTDSLASVHNLNVFAEMAEIRRLAPSIPARRILESATCNGAEALGFSSELGTLQAGKRADMIAVRVPPYIDDVEEYLVGGIEPFDVRWVVG